jgi:uncharacterized iron-regulated membrane protein
MPKHRPCSPFAPDDARPVSAAGAKRRAVPPADGRQRQSTASARLNSPLRRLAVLLHRYIGLALAVTLLISALTGTAIVFAKPIDAWLNAGLLRVVPQDERVSVDTILAGVRQALPHNNASMVFMAQAPDQAWEIWFRENRYFRAYVDPYSGELLGTRDVSASLVGWLVYLHIDLLSGASGKRIMGWSGLGAIGLSLVGLYLWWPRQGRWKQALSVKWHAAPVRVWLDIHKLIGCCMCILIVLTAATGSALALQHSVTEPLLVALTGEGTKQPAPTSRAAVTRDAAIEPMLRQARLTFPEGRLSRLGLPATPDGAVMVRMRLDGEIHQYGRSFLWFDRYDGTLLKAAGSFDANLATRIKNWLFPLHTGFYGGTVTRILQILTGLSLATLILSGAWLWWKGFAARRIAANRALHQRHA